MNISNQGLADETAPTITRRSSGCGGLDDLLGGGLPVGHICLEGGEPGTGKTTLALQFISRGLKRGKTFYMQLFPNCEAFGWTSQRRCRLARPYAQLQ